MIITRKQYEMNLRRAKAEGRKEAFKEANAIDRMNCMERNIYDSIERLEGRINRIMDEIKKYKEPVEIVEGCECNSKCCND